MDNNEFNIIFINAKKRRLCEILNNAVINEDSKLKYDLEIFINRVDRLLKTISENTTFYEDINNQFFISRVAVNRIFRDRGWDEVADIYNEINKIALKYLTNKT